jgi:NAD(P)-dependent dehydrogenase (short-subunit alcohol dehydrogenase family)
MSKIVLKGMAILVKDIKLIIEKNVNFKTILRIEKNKIPLKRFGQPSDILNLIKFLVYKNTWMTGSNIVIDGGKFETLD